MRSLTIAALAPMLAVGLAACSNQAVTDEDDLEDFRPPSVYLRGDVVQNAQRRFETLDKNKDGFVTAEDFRRNGAARVKQRDMNGDNRLSRSEYVEGALKRFDEVDTNKDGQITPDEEAAARTARANR